MSSFSFKCRVSATNRFLFCGCVFVNTLIVDEKDTAQRMDFIGDWRGCVPSIVSWTVDSKSGVVTTSSCLQEAKMQPFSTVSLVAAAEHKKTKEVGICRFFFENGRCLKGDSCPYSHSLAALVKSGGISRTRPSVAPPPLPPVCEGAECTSPDQPVWLFPDAPFIFQHPPFIVPPPGVGPESASSPCFVPPQVPFVFAAVPSPDGEPAMFVPMPLMSPFVPPCTASESPCENEEGDGESSAQGDDCCCSEGAEREEKPQQQQRKKRVCSFFYHNGHCQRGSSCHFLHEWAPGMEVPPLPQDVARDRGCHGQSVSVPIPLEKKSSSQPAHSLTGQILESASHKFLDPVCGETTAAFFPRRRSTRPPREHHSPSFLASGLFRSKPCMFFFETGFCLKGDRCNFSHDPRVLMDQVSHGAFPPPGRSGF